MRILVPPPVVLFVAGLLMWGVARLDDAAPRGIPLQGAVIGVLVAAALALMLAAAVAFARARTSINPMRPGQATTLLTTGVFRISRNPIYLADALLLAAFGVWLGSPWNVLVLAAFLLYIDLLQIRAEEAALLERFGDAYRAYCDRVRRWL